MRGVKENYYFSCNDGVFLVDFMHIFNQNQNLELFGKTLNGYKTWVQLTICVVGTLFFHVISGICLEQVFLLEGFRFGVFLTLSQFVIYSILAKIGHKIRNNATHRRETPIEREEWRWYVCIALFMITTMGLTNYALHLVPFTFIQLIKSAKLIPVMIGSKIVLNKSYSTLEYLSAILIGLGLTFLVLEKLNTDSVKDPGADDPGAHFLGFFLLSIALVADAFIGNFQEKVMRDYSATQEDVIYYCYFLGSFMLLFVSIVTGEFIPALIYCSNSISAIFWLLCFSITGHSFSISYNHYISIFISIFIFTFATLLFGYISFSFINHFLINL